MNWTHDSQSLLKMWKCIGIMIVSMVGLSFGGTAIQGVSFNNAVPVHGSPAFGLNYKQNIGLGNLAGYRYPGSPVGFGVGTGLTTGYGSSHAGSAGGGFNIGNGYLGYSNYQRSQPLIFQTKQPVSTIVYKPEPARPNFSVTPSISYGYSYKLVPTHAYGPGPVQKYANHYGQTGHGNQQSGIGNFGHNPTIQRLGGSLQGLLGGLYGHGR